MGGDGVKTFVVKKKMGDTREWCWVGGYCYCAKWFDKITGLNLKVGESARVQLVKVRRK